MITSRCSQFPLPHYPSATLRSPPIAADFFPRGPRHSFLRLQSIAFLKENKEVIQNGPARLSADFRTDKCRESGKPGPLPVKRQRPGLDRLA
jgi:hypothetical protein